MRQFPVYHSIIIVVLLTCIFCVVKFLPSMLGVSDYVNNKPKIEERPINTKKAKITFRYSSTPKSITLTDSENQLIYQSDSPESNSEHDTPHLFIPLDTDGHSDLKLLVEWSEQPEGYHFFTVELNAAPLEKFGLDSVTSELAHEFTVLWK